MPKRNNNRNNNNQKKNTVVVVQPPRRRQNNRVTTIRPARIARVQKNGPVSEIGEMIGGVIGLPKVGKALGSTIGRIFGSGEYTLTGAMPHYNTLAGTTPPSFGAIGGTTRIRHREFIADITGSINFNVESYPLNPGTTSLFPWLSKMARNFDQYRIHGMLVEFKSTSASALNSTNTALGVVGLATIYNATESDFASKQIAENYEGAQSCNPSQSMMHFIECERGQNPLDRLYVRSDFYSGDLKFYDLGKIQLFTQGMQASAVIGELWVSYDIEFYKPNLHPDNSQIADRYQIPQFIATNSNPLGTVFPRTPEPGGSLGSSLQSGTVIRVPADTSKAGNYMCMYYFNHNGTGTVSVGQITPVNGTSINCLNGNLESQTLLTTVGGTDQDQVCTCKFFQWDGLADLILTWSGWTLGGTGSGADILITKLPPGVVSDVGSFDALLPNSMKPLLSALKQEKLKNEQLQDQFNTFVDGFRNRISSIESYVFSAPKDPGLDDKSSEIEISYDKV